MKVWLVAFHHRVKGRVLGKKDLLCGPSRLKLNAESLSKTILAPLNHTKVDISVTVSQEMASHL